MKALETLRQRSPQLFNILKEGIFEINLDKKNETEKIESAVRVYLNANNINLSEKVTQLLVMFVKYDTSTESRKKISRELGMTRATINQNTSKLKKSGMVVYPDKEGKKSKVHPELRKLKEYILTKQKNNILIKYGT